jgi:hypothetical protein
LSNPQVSFVSNRPTATKDKGPETAGVEGVFDLLEGALGQFGGFFKQLMQAASINPFLGAVLGLILADMLYKAKLITSTTKALVQGVSLTYLGVNVTTDVLQAISNLVQDIDPLDILKGITGPQPPTQALQPTVNAVVFSGDTQGLEALLGKIQKGVS